MDTSQPIMDGKDDADTANNSTNSLEDITSVDSTKDTNAPIVNIPAESDSTPKEEEDSVIETENEKHLTTDTDFSEHEVNLDDLKTAEGNPDHKPSTCDSESLTTSVPTDRESSGEPIMDLTVTGQAIKLALDVDIDCKVSDVSEAIPLCLQEEINQVRLEEDDDSNYNYSNNASDSDSVTQVQEHMAQLLESVDFVDGSTLGSSTFEGGVFHVSSCSDESERADIIPGDDKNKYGAASSVDDARSSNSNGVEGSVLSTDAPSEGDEALGECEEIDFTPQVISAEASSVGDDETIQTVPDDSDTNTIQRDVSIDIPDDLTADVASELSYQDSDEERIPAKETNNNSEQNAVLTRTQSTDKDSLVKSLTFGSLTADDLRLNLGELGASMESDDMDWNEESLNSLICSGIEDMFEQSGFSKSDARDMLKQAAVQEAVRTTIQEQMATLSTRKAESMDRCDSPDAHSDTNEDHPPEPMANNDTRTEEEVQDGVTSVENAVPEPTPNTQEAVIQEHRASSPLEGPGDELLSLLDNISHKGERIRGELEMAYARESMLKDELELDEHCMNQVHESFSSELDIAKAENEQLSQQLSAVSKTSAEHRAKAGKLESLVERLQGHVDQLAKQVAEANYREQMRRQGLKHISVTTDLPYTYNIGIQTDMSPLLFDQGVQVSQSVTSTHSLPDASAPRHDPPRTNGFSTPTASTPVHSPRPTDSPRSPSRATAMIDKILKQMSNIAETGDPKNTSVSSASPGNTSICEALKEIEAEPEGLDKWRHLAMTRLTSDPNVLALQKSLASATLENDLIQSKFKKHSKDSARKVEELNREVEEAQMGLLKANEQNEILRVRNEGDQADMDILKDKIAELEKKLSMAEIESDRLDSRFGTTLTSLKCSLNESVDEATAVDTVYKIVQKQLTDMEEDRQRLTEVSV